MPSEASLQDLKRLCRYLVKKPDISQVFSRQAKPSKLRVQVGSDRWCRGHPSVYDRYDLFVWRTCLEAREQRAVHDCPIDWQVRVPCFGEGWISRTLGLQSLFEDFQVPISVVVKSDATAAKGTVNRIGLGRARHIQTRYLWLQERVAMDHLKVIHVPGKRNRADMLTKSVPATQTGETLRTSGYVFLVVRVSLHCSDPKRSWSRLRYEILGGCCGISSSE